MIEFLAIFLLGLSDRVRGSGWFRFNHGIGMLGMNIAAIFLLHANGWQIPYILLVPVLGYASGVMPALGCAFNGQPMPDKSGLTWWQFGPLQTNVFLAVAFRGLLWGLPFAALNPLYVLPFVVAFTITPYIFGPIQRKFPNHDIWAWMEFTRGLLSGLGLYLLHANL